MSESPLHTELSLSLPVHPLQQSSLLPKTQEFRRTKLVSLLLGSQVRSSPKAMSRGFALMKECRCTTPTEPAVDLGLPTKRVSTTNASPISLRTWILLVASIAMLSWSLSSYPPQPWGPFIETLSTAAFPKASPSASKATPSQPVIGEEIPVPSGMSSQHTTPPTVTSTTSTSSP